MLKDYRLPLEVEIPTTPYHVANNLFAIGWSKQFEGIHLLKMSLHNLTWKEEINFLEYINPSNNVMNSNNSFELGDDL